MGMAVVAVGSTTILAITHWSVVRDHVEGWSFQLMKETITIEPGRVLEAISSSAGT
jgi:hypothetical protein